MTAGSDRAFPRAGLPWDPAGVSSRRSSEPRQSRSGGDAAAAAAIALVAVLIGFTIVGCDGPSAPDISERVDATVSVFLARTGLDSVRFAARVIDYQDGDTLRYRLRADGENYKGGWTLFEYVAIAVSWNPLSTNPGPYGAPFLRLEFTAWLDGDTARAVWGEE